MMHAALSGAPHGIDPLGILGLAVVGALVCVWVVIKGTDPLDPA
ncbi:hypothetical protein QN357_01610 [Cryobacterium sp. RTC2.1]|nr:hypothetical protein [Cryobacterium sp. RTC2.1]MEB0001633.1 hypothetical protein [Cryobacterium sp. RTC2.1]